MTTTHKARSYTVRQRLAEILEKPLHADFDTNLDVLVDDGRALTLTGTTNLGFAGIGGLFTDEAGDIVHLSLGAVTSFYDERIGSYAELDDHADARALIADVRGGGRSVR